MSEYCEDTIKFDLGYCNTSSIVAFISLVFSYIALFLASTLYFLHNTSVIPIIFLLFVVLLLHVFLYKARMNGDNITVTLIPITSDNSTPLFKVEYGNFVIREGTLFESQIRQKKVKLSAGRYQHISSISHQIYLEIEPFPTEIENRKQEGLVLFENADEIITQQKKKAINQFLGFYTRENN